MHVGLDAGEEQQVVLKVQPDPNPRWQPAPAKPQAPVGMSVTMDEKKPDFEEKEFSDLEQMPSKPTFKDKKPGFVDFGRNSF
jgi:hypothetical protein